VKQSIPAPTDVRQTLLAFALYNASEELNSLLSQIDFTGVTRRQLYFSVLGRAPENVRQAVDGADYRPRAHFANALRSDEFQNRIREIALAAFPEKRRVIFVHVPKCAGTDMRVALRRRHAFLHHDFALARITDKPALFQALHDFALRVHLSDGIAITGHAPLRWYVERKIPRFDDDLFSTIRHPREIMYSYISYILTRLLKTRDAPAPDTTEWLAHMGMAAMPPDATPAYLADLGGRLLRCKPVATPNILCDVLGRGTAGSAIETIVTSNIELTDTSRYSAWRREKFGFDPPNRINPSDPLFTPGIASTADRALIDDMIGEDMVLYERILRQLDASESLSIRGSVLS
jgi:hypothetical protein